MNRPMWRAAVEALRRAAAPLAWYYAVTLALPLANGAAQSGAAFREHALLVLGLPPVLIVLACTTRGIARAIWMYSRSVRRQLTRHCHLTPDALPRETFIQGGVISAEPCGVEFPLREPARSRGVLVISRPQRFDCAAQRAHESRG